MKKRRFPLSLAILLPTIVAIVLGLGGIYVGAYFAMRDSAYQAAVHDDAQELGTLSSILEDDDPEHVGVSYGLVPVIEAYEANKPSALPTPGSAEETAYKELIAKSTASQLYEYVANKMERFVTSFLGFFYEDTASNRMVLVCSSNRGGESEKVETTSLYVGSFFHRDARFDQPDFYGDSIRDEKLGRMMASGICFGELRHPIRGTGPYRVWIVRETAEVDIYSAMPEFNKNFAIIAGVVLLALAAIIYLLLYFLVVRPTRRLWRHGNEFISALREGQVKKEFAPSSSRYGNELHDLNDSFYYSQEAIEEYSEKIVASAAYEEKINADLALAERIQASMVPDKPLQGKEFLVRGYMRPAREVGGDLYSYFRIDENRVGFYIGDVSGKGVPAALFMAKANTLLRLTLKDSNINEANKILCEGNAENFFVTAFLAVLDLRNGELTYVNCGHEPAFLYQNGKYRALDEEPNFLLGCIPDFEYKVQKTKLRHGDRLFLYTDGISEATNVDGELFGRRRILDCLNAHGNLPSEDTFRAVSEAVNAFVGEAEQSDDECMVALDYAREEEFSFASNLEGLASVQPFCDAFLGDGDKGLISTIQVVLDELCSNVVYYSGSGDKPIRLILRDDGEAIVGTLIDQGKPFNPLEDKPEKEDGKPGGLGLIMVQSMVDELNYRYLDRRNILVFSKKKERK